MAIASVENLVAAINEGKAELLTRASGIGRKTAERIILELKGKLASVHSSRTVGAMESDLDLEEALVGLGYSRMQSREAIARIGVQVVGLEQRLREALKKIKE